MRIIALDPGKINFAFAVMEDRKVLECGYLKTIKSLKWDDFEKESAGFRGRYFDLITKYKYRLDNPDGKNPFIDPEGYVRRVAMTEAAFIHEIEQQKADPDRVAPNPNDQPGPPNKMRAPGWLK